MYLLIDLCKQDSIHLLLFDEAQKYEIDSSSKNRELLAVIDVFFIQQNFRKEDLKGIAVVVGVGSFTSTRIACVVANTFAYVLKISVVAVDQREIYHLSSIIKKISSQPIGRYISATYSAEANITASKAK